MPLALGAAGGTEGPMHYPDDRLPLPSEDEGNLTEESPTGMTDDYLVAQEEGIPYDPPSDRVISEPREGHGGADFAGTDGTDGGELERQDMIQSDAGPAARDDELLGNAIEALRASDVVSGDRVRLAVNGTQVIVRGEVESIEVSDEILGIVGEVPGVTDVVDELEVAGV
jgi:hypothetical protein